MQMETQGRLSPRHSVRVRERRKVTLQTGPTPLRYRKLSLVWMVNGLVSNHTEPTFLPCGVYVATHGFTSTALLHSCMFLWLLANPQMEKWGIWLIKCFGEYTLVTWSFSTQSASIHQMRMEPNPLTIKSICDKIYLFLMIQKPLQCLEVPKITGATESSQAAG